MKTGMELVTYVGSVVAIISSVVEGKLIQTGKEEGSYPLYPGLRVRVRVRVSSLSVRPLRASVH